MSNKAKGLTYEAAQPAFLQRLRGDLTGADSARHKRPIPRNKRLQRDHDDDEDAPAYVLEDTNQSLSKDEYEALIAGKDGQEEHLNDRETHQGMKDAVKDQRKDKIAEVGKTSKKRKAVKVIGTEGNDGQDEAVNGPGKADAKTVKKPKKKAKVVKLSFGDEEEG